MRRAAWLIALLGLGYLVLAGANDWEHTTHGADHTALAVLTYATLAWWLVILPLVLRSIRRREAREPQDARTWSTKIRSTNG